MSDTEPGHVSATAAEVYESFFVPALFAQWTEVVLDRAGVDAGHRVLDVGCGTGVLARAARERVGTGGFVAAVDPNDGMLAVARGAASDIDWQIGTAERLPFPDHNFDRTVSQFALMFFTDPDAALSEMSRVTAPDGRVALAVWDRLENNAGYERLALIIEDLFGPDAADAIRAPFDLGDEDVLSKLAASHLAPIVVARHHGTAQFGSLEAWLHTEIRGWTLAEVIDDNDFATLVQAAHTHLPDLAKDGGVAFDVSAIIVSGTPT
jgi:SAM-dependent methyltransferase